MGSESDKWKLLQQAFREGEPPAEEQEDVEMTDTDDDRLRFNADVNVSPLYQKKSKRTNDENSSRVANEIDQKLWKNEYGSSHQSGNSSAVEDPFKDSEDFRPESPPATFSPNKSAHEDSQAVDEWMETIERDNNDPNKRTDDRLRRKRRN